MCPSQIFVEQIVNKQRNYEIIQIQNVLSVPKIPVQTEVMTFHQYAMDTGEESYIVRPGQELPPVAFGKFI